jgi:single-strand DNA-binding protein
MGSSLNKALLIGHLGKDPEIRVTAEGSPVAHFSLATNEFWVDKSGTRQERTEWHNIVAWNKLADIAKRYLTKGRQVYIEGRIRTREWDDREGNKRRTTEIVASTLVLLGSRGEGQEVAAAPVAAVQRTVAEGEPVLADAAITDDDIPF